MIDLVADVGGTKVDVALFRNGESLRQRRLIASEYSSFILALRDFVVTGEKISSIRVAIAGPVLGEKVKVTNLNWVIDAQELREEFGADQVLLMNDMVAQALGCLSAPNPKILNVGTKNLQKRDKTFAIIAPGTGLGEAIMVQFANGEIRVLPSEGGHCSFAPNTDEEIELLKFARTRFDHVSCERLISGSLGIPVLYDFLAIKHGLNDKSREEHQQKILGKERIDKLTRSVFLAAVAEDPLCVDVLRLFVQLLASEASNLALKSLSMDGVFICGGLPARLGRFLSTESFMPAFTAKGRYKDLLMPIPVSVIEDQENALRGLGTV